MQCPKEEKTDWLSRQMRRCPAALAFLINQSQPRRADPAVCVEKQQRSFVTTGPSVRLLSRIETGMPVSVQGKLAGVRRSEPSLLDPTPTLAKITGKV